jgi:hypothetical protein
LRIRLPRKKTNDLGVSGFRLVVEQPGSYQVDGGFHRLADEGLALVLELVPQGFAFGREAGCNVLALGGGVAVDSLPLDGECCLRGDVSHAVRLGFAGGVGESGAFGLGVGGPASDLNEEEKDRGGHDQHRAAKASRYVVECDTEENQARSGHHERRRGYS